MLFQACQVTRIARVTHAIDPFHTLTRTQQAISRILATYVQDSVNVSESP